MGNKATQFKALIGFQQEIKHVLLVGLKGAGKTTFLYCGSLKGGWQKKVKWPSRGFNYELMQGYVESQQGGSKQPFGVWDLGSTLKQFWHCFYNNITFSGIIFVIKVDGDYEKKIHKSKKLLHWLVNEESLNGVPLAVIFNKEVDENAEGTKDGSKINKQFQSKIDFEALRNTNKQSFVANCKFKQEIDPVLNWMASQLPTNQSSNFFNDFLS